MSDMSKQIVVHKQQSNKQKKKKQNNSAKRVKNVSRSSMPVQKAVTTRQINMGGKKTHTVTHKEYVRDIAGSTLPFLVSSTEPMNPGNSQLFPWLSAMANLYESYIFRKLAFFFEPSCPTSTPGYIALCPDFNPLDVAPTGKVLAFQNEKCKRGSPFNNFSLHCNSQELSKRKTYFARGQDEVIPNANVEVYDTGNLFIIVGGQLDTNILGELWVEATVEFSTPEAPLILPAAFKASNVTAVNHSSVNPLGFEASGTIVNRIPDDAFRLTNNFGASSRVFFDKPFQGLLNTVINGTGLGTLQAIPSGGAQFTNINYAGAATSPSGTQAVSTVAMTAPAGSYVDYIMSNPGALNILTSFMSTSALSNAIF